MGEEIRFIPKTEITIKVGWPAIYPEQKDNPLIFHMNIQLVKEAEAIQRQFLALESTEQDSDQHKHDIAMISLLSSRAPEGFPDFPVPNGNRLAQVISDYFSSGDEQRQGGMGFIARGVMSRYWSAIMPSQYL